VIVVAVALLSLQGSMAFQISGVVVRNLQARQGLVSRLALGSRQPRSGEGRRPLVLGMGLGFGKQAKPSAALDGLQVMSKTGPKRTVPDTIMKPDYAKDGTPASRAMLMPWDIPFNSPEDIEGIRKAGRAAREVLDLAGASVKLGVTTDEIDRVVHEETVKRGGYPSPLNYHGFPKSVCTSINEVVCHGIPCTVTTLKDGDTVNVDVTVSPTLLHNHRLSPKTRTRADPLHGR